MTRTTRLATAAALAILLGLPATRAARAQMGPGGMPGMGPGAQPGMGGGPQEPKEEGPAEEAPEEDQKPADLEPLPGYPEQNKRKLQIFEVDGYLRLRADYMHNFFLGEGYTHITSTLPGGTPQNYGLPLFPLPLECNRPMNGTTITNVGANNPGTACSHKNIGAANLRLRLEPTLNVTDMVRVHAQFDVLDNTILGNTPDSLTGIPGYNRPSSTPTSGGMVSPTSMNGAAPTGFQYTTQDPPEVGQNGFSSSIVAKRAWAEIDSEFGSVRFGRMPWHWGRGIAYNDGGCPDCDVGTTVDRVMALTTLYGHQIAVAWDLGPQGYTTQQLSLGQQSPSGYPYDLSQNDDVLELMASIVRKDNPVQLRERIDRGEPVLNYGLQVVYRNQGNTVTPMDTSATVLNSTTGPMPLTPEQLNQATLFGGLSVTPDVWAKFYYKALTLEFEGIGVFGKIDHPGVLAADNQQVTMRQLGWVIAGELRLYRDAFFVGLETGGATGDQAEDPSQYLNYRWRFVQQPPGDHAINDFHFSPDYHVDEIFFRHIMGTVTNAIYVKPQTAYWFDLGQNRAIGLNGSVIYSAAQVPVSTPGNAINYGVEADVGASYRNTGDGIYGGVTWGLFFPLAALSRPFSLYEDNSANATSAQILRIFMGVRF
ncbi:MAG TPA: TIGR04551 family protein [Polyangia bacterium]|nr:TIGR04551 family protein [Polyangia bacterium]